MACPTHDPKSLEGMPIRQLLDQLGTSPEEGLSTREAKRRLQAYGPNRIDEHEPSAWQRLAKRFWGPIPWMLEGVILLSILLEKWEDALLTFILLIVNAIVDFWQEHKALSALRVLKQKMSRTARVLRDGAWQTLPADELVPGDIVKIRLGDIIPADMRILHATGLLADQSMITGESLPVTLEEGCFAYANSIVKRGEAIGVIIATGRQTTFGRTLSLVARAEREERSHVQRLILTLGDVLIITALILILLTLGVELARHTPLLHILRFSLVLLVASIPVALPAVLTLTMAIGALTLARQHVIVKRLAAVEELAGMDTLMSDKTGTLTLNKMHVTHVQPISVRREEDVIRYALGASREEDHDPLEEPLYAWAAASHVKPCRQESFTPFNPDVKYSEGVIRCAKRKLRVRKGAPQVLIREARLSRKQRERAEDFIRRMAEAGRRVIAVSIQDGRAWRLAGLIALADPPRPDARLAIREARQQQVDVKMITGDSLPVARTIAREVGLGTRILPASVIREAPPGEAWKHAQYADGFAEVLPEDKYQLVTLFQEHDRIVGMMGDGVNDAPALRKADAGIAVANATDAARAAADLILLKDGLRVITLGIRTARRIFRRMEAYATYRIAETLRVLFFMTLAILLLGFYPVTPLMIILLALLNDAPIITIAYDRARASLTPERWHIPELVSIASILGVTGVASSFILLFLLKDVWQLPLGMIQSIIFTKLVVAGHGTLYNTRVKDWFWKPPWPSPVLFAATFGTRFIGTLIAVYGFSLLTPIGWDWAFFIWGYSMAWFLLADGMKMLTLRIIRQGILKGRLIGRLIHPQLAV